VRIRPDGRGEVGPGSAAGAVQCCLAGRGQRLSGDGVAAGRVLHQLAVAVDSCGGDVEADVGAVAVVVAVAGHHHAVAVRGLHVLHDGRVDRVGVVAGVAAPQDDADEAAEETQHELENLLRKAHQADATEEQDDAEDQHGGAPL
jgi:hypothetical protein